MRAALLPFALLAIPLVAGAQSVSRGAERFRAADADRNGLISRAEAARGLPQVASRFDAIDANRDGSLSVDELRAYERSRQRTSRRSEGFTAYFERADTDRDGTLSRAEVEQGLPRLASKFARVDRDRDGRLTRQELRAYFEARRAARGTP